MVSATHIHTLRLDSWEAKGTHPNAPPPLLPGNKALLRGY